MKHSKNRIQSSQTHARVLSGMRVSGKLHLGHYHGVLKNWLKLQYEYECFFFAADWHGLTTQYADPKNIPAQTKEMVIDWLAAGVNPSTAHVFVQSDVPETAELHLLLSMITPLSWLERVPTFKDQQENIQDKDLATYGFLGYPLLQSADILLYKAHYVPVGEDQLSHIEITREIARRFNFLYGKETDFEKKALQAAKKMGKKQADLYLNLRKKFQETGDEEALKTAEALLESLHQLSFGDKERLSGYLAGSSKSILPEPEALLTDASKFPGLDGRKMSKSYDNTIGLREAPEEIEKKIRTMPTDPARVRRQDPGTPEKCPVWGFHQVYSDTSVKDWVQKGCTTAGIGCLECKSHVIDAVKKEVAEIRERAKPYEDNPQLIKHVLAEGAEQARETARETLQEVKLAMGIEH